MAPPDNVGVIDTIVAILKKGGGTIEQIGANFAKKFPDRKVEGMKATTRIQMSRLRTEKGLKIKTKRQKGTNALIYKL